MTHWGCQTLWLWFDRRLTYKSSRKSWTRRPLRKKLHCKVVLFLTDSVTYLTLSILPLHGGMTQATLCRTEKKGAPFCARKACLKEEPGVVSVCGRWDYNRLALVPCERDQQIEVGEGDYSHPHKTNTERDHEKIVDFDKGGRCSKHEQTWTRTWTRKLSASGAALYSRR